MRGQHVGIQYLRAHLTFEIPLVRESNLTAENVVWRCPDNWDRLHFVEKALGEPMLKRHL